MSVSSSTAPAPAPRPPSPRLSAQHFAAAILYLLAGATGLVWVAPELAAGNYLSPHVAGVTHLFTLGWLTTTIFGALYQLLPGALRTPVRWRRVAHLSFWSLAIGAGMFACGIASGSTLLHHGGIALVGLGVILGVTNVAASAARAPVHDVMRGAVLLAITFLFSTLALGVVLLHNIHTGFIAAARLRVLATHFHVAVAGWALIMIVGVSHRLLPMFLLAQGADNRWTKRSLSCLAAGVAVLAVGLNTGLGGATWIGVVLLESGVAFFLRQTYVFYRSRARKQIDVGLRFAATASAFMGAAAVVGPIVLWRGPAATRLAIAYAITGLLGGIVLYVVGFFYKIVPMMAWTARYGGLVSIAGRSPAPSVADMYSPRVAVVQLIAMASGVVMLALSVLGGVSAGAWAGAVLFLGGVVLFVSQILRVALGGRALSFRPSRRSPDALSGAGGSL
jgi:hypothetical protein